MLARFVNSLPVGLSNQLTKIYFQVISRRQRGAHSYTEDNQYTTMDVKIMPVLQDNYMYLIIDKCTREAAIVDPVDPKAVLQAVDDYQVNLTSVLTTHHHWDHAGGNEALAAQVKGIQVYGGDDRIGALTTKVGHNNILNIGQLIVQCIYTPCHTQGHMCYFVSAPSGCESVVFTGDTLFLAGCGRFFEGTPEQMYRAMSLLSQLPDDTKVYCGHEYTLQNLKFAAHVEPDNREIYLKIAWSERRRREGRPTVPSTIGEEKMYNPFMRVFVPAVMKHANSNSAVETMRNIRLEKDNFA